ncbi:MAG: STT3 domain-containing protein [archaeon]
MKFDDFKKPVLDVVSNKKYQWVATFLVLFIVLMMSSSIRLSNWDLLTDSTSGEKIPLALDPFYFLRMAETIVANDGELPEFDEMRHNPEIGSAWHPEIMPRVIVAMWKVSNVFGDYSLRAVDVFSPVFFYGIGLILFFILVYVLTNSKFAGVLASTFLAFSPAYLYRTMAGFSDHESIGIMAFFLALLIYSIALIRIEKKKSSLLCAGLAGIAVALSTLLTYACWSGVTSFLFIIIPVSFFLFWIFKTRSGEYMKKFALKGMLFYACWIVFSLLFAPLFNRTFENVWGLLLGSTNIMSLAIFGFIAIDFAIIFMKPYFIRKNFRLLYSLGVSAVVGFIGLFVVGRNPFSMIVNMIRQLIKPFGSGRFGTTVAENAQPFLQDWVGTVGSQVFWLFLFGSIIFGVYLARKVKNVKRSIILGALYIFMIIGIVFSKYSASSIFNGSNFISQAFYVISLFAFWGYFFYVYLHEKFEWDARDVVMFGILFYTIVAGRAAVRVFFAITPFVCFVAAYFVVKMYSEWRDSKEEILKIVLGILLVIGLIASCFAIYSSHEISASTAERTGPSANYQWQGAMSWVRNNTVEDSVFAHWWDYGYWVQTLGERATIADGGHFQGAEDGNHKIGRYVLTTTNPESALSYFKSMNVSHLLIDQTDLGKYPAYSKIGGGEGETELDRYSAIPVMPVDSAQTRETANGTMVVFSGGMYLFEDIVYADGARNVFLPAGKAAIVGVIVNVEGNSLKQPEAVYVYNNVQTRIPVRYAYVQGRLIDFGTGLDVVIDIIPGIENGKINPMGAAIYLSQKVSDSLFARLYLLDDAFGEYGDLELVHVEDDQVVASLKSQGAITGDFVYYQGFRGPIKIWDVSGVSESVKVVPEFWERINFDDVGFGSLDELFKD